MAVFCIPKNIAEKLKEAAKRGEITVEKLYDMSTKERNALFEKYTDKDLANFINGEFEKAKVKDTTQALNSWVKKTFTGKETKTPKYNDLLAKINSLNEIGALTPEGEKAFLSDLVANKLGATISVGEARTIAEQAKKIQESGSKFTRLGDPTDNPNAQLNYFKEKKKMDDYLDSLTPSGKLRVATSTIGRGNMLFSLPSIIVNINSNNIEGAMGAMVRRFDARAIGGLNNEIMAKYIPFATKIFRQKESLRDKVIKTKKLTENLEREA
jgi:hypothetical protein